MALAPNTDNYSLGKGVVYFNQINSSGVYLGERDLGNAPAFSFNVATEKLAHFSSRGGLKAKDKEVISQITPAISFTLDELSKENIALLTLGDIADVTQNAGLATAEVITAKLGKRADLAYREIGKLWLLKYQDASNNNVIFKVGETVTGAAGGTGIVVSVTGNATSGTLALIKTNATAFVDDEALTGNGTPAGAAEADGIGEAGTVPNVIVTDSAGTTFYTKGTDYDILPSLKDDKIGRIFFPATGGTILDGASVKVTYAYGAASYSVISAFVNSQIIGRLRFVSDNPAGTQQEIQIWSVSLAPTGDTALIGEEWSTLAFTGEVLKDEVGHPNNPYMEMILD